MPATRTATKSIHLIGGDDEFTIKETARKMAEQLAPKKAGEFGLEIIEGETSNQDFALQVISRLTEAINTLPFFGGEKLIWLKSTELFSTKNSEAEAVKDALTDLADLLKRGLPDGVTLLISAIGCDKRRSIYKTLEKIADIRLFEAPEAGKQHGEEELTEFIQKKLATEKKRMDADALAAFRNLVAPELREMANELEKLCLYVGARPGITEADVRAICSATRQAIIWDLTDTLGARRIPAALNALENLLASGESAIGIIVMLVGQFRLTLIARDLAVRKILGPQENGFAYVKAFERLPDEQTAHIPRTKEGRLPSAWRLYRCVQAARNFSTAELIRAMDLLVEANRQLTSTSLDERLLLEEVIIKIAAKPL